MKNKPDVATLIAIRNRYGAGSILRLSDSPTTRQFAQPLTELLVDAAHKYAIRPQRITQFIHELTGSPEEQDYGVRHLREAGPDAIPFLASALTQRGLSDSARRLLVRNMGRLDRTVVQPVAALLDSSDATLAGDAAEALGMIGDQQAIPYLTFPAAFRETAPTLQAIAQAAIAHLTSRSFSSQAKIPTRVLTDAAWRYHRHQVEFPGDPVAIWEWNQDRKALTSHPVSRSEAELILGLQLAQRALQLDPTNHDAKVAELSLILDKSIERVGFNEFPANDETSWKTAKASGAPILAKVLQTAIADGKMDLASVTATALGQVIDSTALSATGHPHPLVDAVYAPGRRVQFAAAKALIALMPTHAFPGSSRIVPTLARFVASQALPRVIVIDGNPNRGSQLAGFFMSLGYDPELETTGASGFRAACETTDVEIIAISYDLFIAHWTLNDTLANLATDSRTAAIPVYIYGPLNVQYQRPNLKYDYPAIHFFVQPGSMETLRQQLRELPPPLSSNERHTYAREAIALLAQTAGQNAGPLLANLQLAQPALSLGLNTPETALSAATALGNIPEPEAQRSLADLVLNPAQPTKVRAHVAVQLAHSIKRFGPLITAHQEERLATDIRYQTDTEMQAKLLALLRVLNPAPITHKSSQPKTPSEPVSTPIQP
jgi:hypothetical protein